MRSYDLSGMDRSERVSAGLLERGAEIHALSELLDRLGEGRGSVVLVEGPAGIGKSSLLEASAQAARDRGMTALLVRGDELVMESSFAAVRELLWPQLRTAGPDALEGAAGLAAPVFDARPGGTGERDRASVVLHGLYWLVADLAEPGPLALLVDDAHWLDAASARFLIYLARRIESLPVLLAVVARTGDRSGSGALAATLGGLGGSVLRPAPLSEDASAQVVRGVLGPRADEDLCRSCHAATRGNPFYLRELAAALKAEGGRPTVEMAGSVRALGAGSIASSVLLRLARLGPDCERLAEAVTVLGPGSSLRHAAALASLDRDRATAAADRLHTAELVSAEGSLSFVHPIVSEAISSQLPPARRAALHGQAAHLLADDGASADRVAAHLLFAAPFGDERTVEALRLAARDALARGAPEAAVSYLRRALAEPPDRDARLEVLLELGRAEVLLPVAHDFAALREALELASSDPGQKAAISLELALALFGVFRSREAREVVEAALEDERDLEPRTIELLEQVLIAGGIDDLTATGNVIGRADRHFARAARGEITDPRMLAALAIVAAVTARSAGEAAALAEQALRDERLLHEWLDDGYVTVTCALCWTDHLEQAAAALGPGLEEAQRRGSAPMFVQLAVMRAETALRAGDLDLAEDYARRGLELGRELGADRFPTLWLPIVLLERGRSGDAAELLEPLGLSGSELGLSINVILLAHRGRVRIAMGDVERGLADLLEADRRMTAARWNLSILCDWVPSAVSALAQLGREDEARALARRELDGALAFGAERRKGIALSVAGTVEPGADGLALLRDAVVALERKPAELEHARALVNLGAGLRARGASEEARTPLSQAFDIAHRLGGTALADLARAELVASGARPRRARLAGPEALTPAELRTARMAAGGMSNREIAQALFVSAKTVETQLSHAYAKLGIAGRSELAASLAEGTAGSGSISPGAASARAVR
jgi:DNA-binding CsgD family transcriptional regulator